MKFILLSIFTFLQSLIWAQVKPDTDLTFLVKKIEMVYAGYNDKVNPKEFEQLINEIEQSELKDTFALLSRLTFYFKDYHLALFQKEISKTFDANVCNKNIEIVDRYKKQNSKKNYYKGYWISEANDMVIYITLSDRCIYSGYVVESKKPIPLGLRIFKLQKKGKEWVADFINIARDYRVFVRSFFYHANTLIIGSYAKFKKINNYHQTLLKGKTEFNHKPSFTVVDTANVVITMPDFSGDLIDVYDSIIKVNEKIIRNSKNLIIDIRNNQGGYTNCYDSLIPFICTHSILRSPSYTLCSQDLIDDAKNDKQESALKKDTALVVFYDKYINKLLASKDTFIYEPSDTMPCASKNNMVKNVGIITNYGCRSAAELMILDLRQSSKVKVFGEHTAGAVDYLNILSFKLPITNFTLWVGTSKRKLTENQPAYDKTGIKPDIEISGDVSDWVDFVKKYYEKN